MMQPGSVQQSLKSVVNLLHLSAVDGPKENRAAVISEEGWEEWLLELLLDGSPCILSAEEQVSLHRRLFRSHSTLCIKTDAQAGPIQCRACL